MTVSSAASRFFSVDKCPRTMTWAFFYAKKQSPLFVTLSKNTPIVYVRKKLRRVQLWKRIIFNNRFCCLSFFAVSIFHYFYGVTRKKYWSWCSRDWEFQKPKHWVWKREIRNNDKKNNKMAPSFLTKPQINNVRPRRVANYRPLMIDVFTSDFN